MISGQPPRGLFNGFASAKVTIVFLSSTKIKFSRRVSKQGSLISGQPPRGLFNGFASAKVTIVIRQPELFIRYIDLNATGFMTFTVL